MTICIKNAIIINNGEKTIGSVIIENDIIRDVYFNIPEPDILCDNVIDAHQCYLMPGVIDDHVHFRDPGLTAKADMFTESMAAAAGGVTSFMDMPNCKPQTVTLEALENKFQIAAEKSIVNYSFYFGATNDNADLFSSLDKSRVCGIKLFMGASTGNMLVENPEALKQIFSKANMLIAAHCEDPNIIQWNSELARVKYGEDPDVAFHSKIRSEKACWRSSALAVQLAKETGARLHVLHVSTASELELFEDKPLSEKRITAEVCVPHLMFCDKDYQTLGALIKCNPSIKTESDREALRKALATDLIDVIGTDHAPHLLNEKQGGALKAVSGMPSVQFSLPCVMELVRNGVLTVEQAVKKMCHIPAGLFGIEKRGYIRPGYKADLVIVNPECEWTVTRDCVLSKCGWSPYEGMVFHTKVEKTFVNGELVYADGKVNTAHRGEALCFSR
ncbi:dihydroorotase [Bacteroides gallinaceum]|uniref:dihydroorotase n=1 Tax=Bacteroides gallinaceum TaxID=1462571 RepID=UPI0025A39AF4|nr:dihydroorotase [Bacteroides gallinaceum]MDM8153740.1 dihydroorotase [Bacteroides gallinaceum]